MKFDTRIGSFLGLLVLFSATLSLAFFHDLSYAELKKDFIPGLHGVRLASREKPSFSPLEPLEKNLSLEGMLSLLCERGGLSKQCYLGSGVRFRVYTEDYLVGGKPLIRGVIPLRVHDISKGSVLEAMQAMAGWMKENQNGDGSLPYLYSPSLDSYSASDNAIRQMLTIQGLFALSRVLADGEVRALALRAERIALRRWFRGAHFVDNDGKSSLGVNAVGILMLLESGEGFSKRVEALSRYVATQQKEDGSFRTYPDSDLSENERFYAGEALFALARVESLSGAPSYDLALQKGAMFYRKKLSENFYPQYAPWLMQAYTTAYQSSGREEYKNLVYWLADGLIETMLEGDARARPEEDGRFFNPLYPAWGPPHTASTGVYVEGLTAAYEIAKGHDEEKATRYKDAILRGTRSLLQLQWTPTTAYYLSSPRKVLGAFKASITNNTIRIDQLGHAANALSQVYDAVLP